MPPKKPSYLLFLPPFLSSLPLSLSDLFTSRLPVESLDLGHVDQQDNTALHLACLQVHFLAYSPPFTSSPPSLLSLTHSHLISCSLSLTHSHSFTPLIPLPHHPLTPSTPSLPPSLPHTLPPSFTHTHLPHHSLTHSLTHSHTHSLTPSLPHSLSQGHEDCALAILEKCSDDILQLANNDQKTYVVIAQIFHTLALATIL